MEANRKIILVVPLICCSLLSAINAVPSHRLSLLEEATSAAQAPSPSGNGVSKSRSPPNAQLEALCRDQDAPALCVETIAPSIQGALDPVAAVKVEMAATTNLTLKISKTIKALQERPHIAQDDLASLLICEDQYASIVDTVKDCLDSVNHNDVYDAWMKFSSVLSFQQACEDAFKEGGSTIPFPEDSKTLFQLGSNCLGILMYLCGESPSY